jgi:hypothetical protein
LSREYTQEHAAIDRETLKMARMQRYGRKPLHHWDTGAEDDWATILACATLNAAEGESEARNTIMEQCMDRILAWHLNTGELPFEVKR